MFDTLWILLFVFLGAARAARDASPSSSDREAKLALRGPMCVLCRGADRSGCRRCNRNVSWPKRLSVTDEGRDDNKHCVKEQWSKYNGVYIRVSNTCSLCKGVGEYYGFQCRRCHGSSVGDAPYRYVRWCPNCDELGSTCKCVASSPYQLRFGKLYPPEFYKKGVEEVLGDELDMEFEEAMKYYATGEHEGKGMEWTRTAEIKNFERKIAVRYGGGFQTWLLEPIPTTKAAQEASQLVHDKSGETMGLWGGKLYPVLTAGPVPGFAEPSPNQQGLLDDVYVQTATLGCYGTYLYNPTYYGTMPVHQHLPHTNTDPVPNEICAHMSDPCRRKDGDHQHKGRFKIEPVPEPVEQ